MLSHRGSRTNLRLRIGNQFSQLPAETGIVLEQVGQPCSPDNRLLTLGPFKVRTRQPV